MSVISFYITVPFFSGVYLALYKFAIILLLTGTLFKNKIKSESYNLLYVFNTLAAWCSLFVFLAYTAELFMAWYGQNSYEWYAFKENGARQYGNVIFIISLLFFVLGLFLFFRKLRTSRWFTLLFFLSGCGFIYERIIIYITSRFRDYLPSSWSTHYDPVNSRDLYAYAEIILLLVVLYVWAKKKRRLPFPSVFLK